MPDTFTHNIRLRKRVMGSMLPPSLQSDWVSALNHELFAIDDAIGAVCTPQQVRQIKAMIHGGSTEGVILNG